MQELIQNLTVNAGWVGGGAEFPRVSWGDLEALLTRISDDQHARGNVREGIALERVARLVETHWADPSEHAQAIEDAREAGQESGYDTGWDSGRDDGREERADLKDRIDYLEKAILDMQWATK